MKRRAKASSIVELGFGPGMDLIVSLFAMALIVMLIGNLFYNGVTTILDGEIDAKTNELDSLERRNATLKNEIIKLRKKLSESYTLESTLKEFVSANPQYENLSLQNILKKLRKQIISLEVELEKMKPLLVFELLSEKAALFELNSNRLTYSAKERLKPQAKKILELLKGGSANQLNILGYASPEPKNIGKYTAMDGNLDLSANRSVAVAHYLHSLGIPYECISVTGYGRGRSEILNDWKKRGPQYTTKAWDKNYSWYGNSPSYRRKSRRERKVVLSVVFVKESKCEACFK